MSCRHDRHPSQPLHPRHEPTPPHPPLTVSLSFPNHSFTYLKPLPTRTRTQRTPIDPTLHFAKNGDRDGMLIHALHTGIYARMSSMGLLTCGISTREPNRKRRMWRGKMKAQYATMRMVKGGYGQGVGNESEYGDKARFEARKQVKREGVGGFGVGQVEDEETRHGCRY